MKAAMAQGQCFPSALYAGRLVNLLKQGVQLWDFFQTVFLSVHEAALKA